MKNFPSKQDIQFFYELGFYNDEDLTFFVKTSYLTEKEKQELTNGGK